MNIALYIADLTIENQCLMPWRTVLEVLSELKIAGHNTLLLSGRFGIDGISEVKMFGDVEVFETPRPFEPGCRQVIAAFLNQRQIKILYFPIAFVRDYRPLMQIDNIANCQIAWYIPGGWYKAKQILKSIRYIGLKSALPYLVQAFMPKRFFIKRLIGPGARAVLAMSEYTAEQLCKYGYPPELVFAAPPGKAPVKVRTENSNVYPSVAAQLTGHRYFLFFGPPNPIRGVIQIIAAFSALAKQRPDVKLVCLFRADANVDSWEMRKLVKETGFADQIICFWESINGADLDLFLQNCFAVLKPFLIVPSEIPLAVLETAGYGKPVIGTGPDGTGAFIDKFGLTVPHANAQALTDAMTKLLDSPELYERKCRCAMEVYEKHPDWCSVAKIWKRAGEAVST
jgi:glycosyltransferase involved in cell wall biosynthesis